MPRLSVNKETQSPAASAAVVLAAVNSGTMLNPLISPLVDPQACASAIVNAAHSSYPEVLLQSNQVTDKQSDINFEIYKYFSISV